MSGTLIHYFILAVRVFGVSECNKIAVQVQTHWECLKAVKTKKGKKQTTGHWAQSNHETMNGDRVQGKSFSPDFSMEIPATLLFLPRAELGTIILNHAAPCCGLQKHHYLESCLHPETDGISQCIQEFGFEVW